VTVPYCGEEMDRLPLIPFSLNPPFRVEALVFLIGFSLTDGDMSGLEISFFGAFLGSCI